MAKEGQSGLEAITGALARAGAKGPPPVERWNPPFCGDLDMRIAADGTWFYMKTPIGRPALVKLFASVLKREGDSYFLVTPVEKCGITVDDAPFLAVELNIENGAEGRVLHFRTNVDDWVSCGPQHALRFEPEAGTGGGPFLLPASRAWLAIPSRVPVCPSFARLSFAIVDPTRIASLKVASPKGTPHHMPRMQKNSGVSTEM